MTHQAIEDFSGLLSTSLRTLDRPERFFNLCSNFRLLESFFDTPMLYRPRFNMQLIFSARLQYECPGAVLTVEEELMVVTVNKTFGFPLYHESSMLSLICVINQNNGWT